jgi:arsenite methyltransferase
VEMTPEMLERARSNAARLKFPNVEFREGYLESLPVEDNRIDIIISNCVINLSPDKPQVFREMHRVLKPGGRIAVSDMVTNHAFSEEARKNKDGWCSCTAGALPVKEYTEELRQAGFVNIRIEPNVEAIIKAFESGLVRLPQGRTIEQMLEDLRSWEHFTGTMIAPHNITASKPA